MARINQVHEFDVTTTDENGFKHNQHSITTTYDLGQEPPYVKLYLDAVLYLSDMPKGHSPIMLSIIKRIPWANQEQGIAINSSVKRLIAKELNCSVTKIDHAITDFVKGELLIREDIGLYRINPYIFGRGEWKDIAELRLHVTFNVQGKTIMGEVIRKSHKPTIDENQLTLPEVNNEYITRTYPTSPTSEPCRVPA